MQMLLSVVAGYNAMVNITLHVITQRGTYLGNLTTDDYARIKALLLLIS